MPGKIQHVLSPGDLCVKARQGVGSAAQTAHKEATRSARRCKTI